MYKRQLIGFVKGANFVIGKVAPKMPQIKLDLYTRLATGEYCNRLYFEKAIETPDVFSWKGTQKGGADNGEQFATTALLKGYSPKQTLAADLLKAGDVRITFKASDDGRMVTKTGREWSIEVAHHPDGFVGKFTLPDGTLVGSKP